jgi:hypothetical protein
VLPFLDLTEGMHQEEFADGMTEELIDKLSKIPSLRVPAPTSSLYFKGKYGRFRMGLRKSPSPISARPSVSLMSSTGACANQVLGCGSPRG